MVLVIYQVRARSREAAAELCRLFLQISGRQMRGWIGGRCMVSVQDTQQVLAYEEWNSRESWEAWFNSEARLNRYRQAAPLRDGELQINVYEEP